MSQRESVLHQSDSQHRELCGMSVDRMSRTCNEPATHIYHGIGGRQPVCAAHAEHLRRRFGIKATPVEVDRGVPGAP